MSFAKGKDRNEKWVFQTKNVLTRKSLACIWKVWESKSAARWKNRPMWPQGLGSKGYIWRNCKSMTRYLGWSMLFQPWLLWQYFCPLQLCWMYWLQTNHWQVSNNWVKSMKHCLILIGVNAEVEISGSESSTVRDECRSKCSQLPTVFYSGIRMVGLNRSIMIFLIFIQGDLQFTQTKVQSQLNPNVNPANRDPIHYVPCHVNPWCKVCNPFEVSFHKEE